MAREVVRRICGHAEAVYAVGPPGRIAKKIERSSGDLCRTCRDRLQTSAFEVVVSERSRRSVRGRGRPGRPRKEKGALVTVNHPQTKGHAMSDARDLMNDFGGDPIAASGIPEEEMEETDFDFSSPDSPENSEEKK